MKLRSVSSFLLLLLGLAGSLCAQDGKNYSYHTSARSSGQSSEEKEDIGEIEEVKGGFDSIRNKLRFSADLRAAYTTNALLEGNHGSSDAVLLPTLQAGFHTPLGKYFSFDLSTQIDSANYLDNTDRSFAGYSAMATLDYRPKKGLPRIYATVEPYRFDSYDTGDLLSQAIGFTGGLDWGVAFNAGRTLGFVGYSFTSYIADPSIDSRNVQRAIIGVAHQIRSNLTSQLYYMYQYGDFTDFDRRDSKNTVAGNIIYQFNEHWFGSITAAFVDNDSTQDNAGYQSFSTTLGVTVQF